MRNSKTYFGSNVAGGKPTIIGSYHRGNKLLIGILIVAVLVMYANTFTNGYALDDVAVISRNAYVAKGISGIRDIVTTPSLSGFVDRPVYANEPVNDIYRPVSLCMFAIERQLFGDTPLASHVMNVLLYVGCVLLLFLFLSRLLGADKITVVFIASLLFAVHPIHTEVVTNIKSRDELLCFFFMFGSLVLCHRYVVPGGIMVLAAGAVLYFLSLLSKETSISLLAIMPIVLLHAGCSKKRVAIATVATCIVAAAYLTLRYSILAAHNANHPGLIDFIENPLVGAPSLLHRVANALLVMGRYLWLLFVPYPLCSDYTFASVPFVGFGDVGAWAALLVYCSIAMLGAYRLFKKRGDVYAVGIVFFLFSIVIFSNILFLTGSIMAERFLFLPSVGFCLVASSLLVNTFQKRKNKNALWLTTVVISIVFVGTGVKRNSEWRDNYTLAKADVLKYPGNARLWHSLGIGHVSAGYDAAGDEARKRLLLEEGIDCMRKSLSIYAKQYKVHADMANVFVRQGKFDSAEAHMLQALSFKPADPVLISALGGVYFAQQKYGQTIALCRQAMQRSPDNTAIMNNIALCHLQMKQFDSAALYAQKVLLREPGNSMASSTLEAARNAVKQ